MIKYKEEKMLFEQILISLMLFTYLTYSQIEINFHLTEWMKNEVHIQQNCLFISVPYTKDYNERQILSFCMSELPSKFHIKPNRMDSIFTFDQLAEENVTIEQYQVYLPSPSTILVYC